MTITIDPTVTPTMFSETFSQSGLLPIHVSPPALMYLDPTLLWMPFTGSSISYELTGPPGTYTILGTVNISEPILGDTKITIPVSPGTPDPAANPDVPRPDILGMTWTGNGIALTFTSVVDKAYLVLTNSTLLAPSPWCGQKPVIGHGATTTTTLPTNAPANFYRIRYISKD